jgi:hypothetical protein
MPDADPRYSCIIPRRAEAKLIYNIEMAIFSVAGRVLLTHHRPTDPTDRPRSVVVADAAAAAAAAATSLLYACVYLVHDTACEWCRCKEAQASTAKVGIALSGLQLRHSRLLGSNLISGLYLSCLLPSLLSSALVLP